MKKTIIVAAVFFVTAIAPIKLYGWGGGHDYVNRLALTVMPPEIKSFLGEDNSEKFIEWSHAPDDFTPWLELKNVKICAEDLEILNKWEMKQPYSLHSHQGHAVNFILLVNAFQAKDPQRAAYWMSTLMHTEADEIACNHDPLIHIMTYGFKDYGLDMGNGIGVDFADVAKTDKGSAIIQELLSKVQIKPIKGDSRKVLLKVMMSGIEGNVYLTQRGCRIAASYAENATDAVRRDSMTAMAELGVKGIAESMDIILTAWNMAGQGTSPVLDNSVEEEYKQEVIDSGRKRLLRNDSLFTELLDDTMEKQPYIGALVEPSISMNKAKLGFSSKYITASAVRTMRLKGVLCRLLDIRELEESRIPDVKTMPLLLICAGGFNVSDTVKNQLQKYIQGGGKLLWIGGEHKGQLGTLSAAMKPVDNTLLPVSSKYGKDSPVLSKSVISFDSDFKKVMGEQEFRFTHNPNTKAGWQRPLCSYRIKENNSGIVPLAELRVDDSTMIIAAAGKNSKGDLQYIFLPEYLISPYLLSDEKVIKDPSRPVLDSVGTKILLESINILMPL